jgi:hypothetical protein
MASWLDLIDDASLDRFVAAGGNEDDDIVQVERDIETENLLSPVGGELPVRPNLYDTELLSQSETSAMHDDGEIETEASEITILPSISSSENLLRDRLFASHGSVLLVGHNDFPSESSSASLSLHPESVDSSIMTDLTEERMISSVSSDEESNADVSDVSSVASETSRRNDEWERHGDLPTTNTTTGITSTSSSDATSAGTVVDSRWYSRFQNEQDWDDFRTAAYQLLQAVDCPEADRDELMTQLIAQEEAMFWDAKESKNRCGGGGAACDMCAEQDKTTWLVELAAVVATVAITGVALVRFLKGR